MKHILRALAIVLAVSALSAAVVEGASAQIPGTGLTAFNTTTKTHETANLVITELKFPLFTVTAGSAPLTCEGNTYTGKTSGTEETPKV
jgi:hypothetical protein